MNGLLPAVEGKGLYTLFLKVFLIYSACLQFNVR